jgi:hypothetical protein
MEKLIDVGFNPRLDFSHRPGVMPEVSAVDAVHYVITLGI